MHVRHTASLRCRPAVRELRTGLRKLKPQSALRAHGRVAPLIGVDLSRWQKRRWTSLESRDAPGIAISLTLRSFLLQLLRVFLFLRRSGGDFLLCLPGVVGFAHDGLPLCRTLTEDDATPFATQACVDSEIFRGVCNHARVFTRVFEDVFFSSVVLLCPEIANYRSVRAGRIARQ